MAESWFSLSREDQVEALEFAAARSGRPAHLLEKDIWVVWVLSAIYESTLASKLTFKGGTSLSKVYRIIDRFSEDVDLTYDIRELAADLLKEGNPIPDSASQEKKICHRTLKTGHARSLQNQPRRCGEWMIGDRFVRGKWWSPGPQ